MNPACVTKQHRSLRVTADKNFRTLKSIFHWKPHGLASACCEKASDVNYSKTFHNRPKPSRAASNGISIEGTEVFIRRDSKTGDVVLSRKPDSWQGFFDLLASTMIPANFMDDRKQPAAPRNPFESWAE